MTAEELGDELGRSTSWIYDHWSLLAKRDRMPHPLHGQARPLVWSRAQIYAWLDRGLTPPQRLAAQAYRAALAAAMEAPCSADRRLEEADWTGELNRKMGVP